MNKNYELMCEELFSKLFSAGNKAQMEKLKRNMNKIGWNNIDIKFAISRIYQEYRELKRIFTDRGALPPKDHYKRYREEAADIANFAHMIILRCDNEINKEKTK